jgi:prefoldin subunit 5
MNELKMLESRCENLKYMTREEMQKQIVELNQEIESLRASNKELARGNTLNGLNICRG